MQFQGSGFRVEGFFASDFSMSSLALEVQDVELRAGKFRREGGPITVLLAAPRTLKVGCPESKPQQSRCLHD